MGDNTGFVRLGHKCQNFSVCVCVCVCVWERGHLVGLLSECQLLELPLLELDNEITPCSNS